DRNDVNGFSLTGNWPRSTSASAVSKEVCSPESPSVDRSGQGLHLVESRPTIPLTGVPGQSARRRLHILVICWYASCTPSGPEVLYLAPKRASKIPAASRTLA